MPTNGLSCNYNIRLLSSCFFFWLYTFGVFTVAIEITNHWTALFLVLAPIVTFVVVKKLSVPRPSDDLVEEVLGQWPEFDSDDVGLPDKDSEGGSSTSNPLISVWAHRFAGFDAPENTLEALEKCIQNGAKAVEFDLILTADLVPVVFHDPGLNRITNIDGDIRHLPWSTVKTFDASCNHPFRSKFPDARIPHFDDVVKKCVENKIHMVVDVKDDRPEVATIILDTFNKYPEMYKLALVSSFNIHTIWTIRKMNPSIVAGLTWRPYYLSYSTYSPDESRCVARPNSVPMYYLMRLLDVCHIYVFNYISHSLVGNSVVLLQKDQITREVVNRWKKQHIRVMAWTVNIPLEKKFFTKRYGVPIITDSMFGPTDTK